MMARILIVFSISFTFASAAPAWGQQDRVQWMATKLLQGENIRNYELALGQFVKQSDPRVLPFLLKMTEQDRVQLLAETAGVLWIYDNKEVRQRLVALTQNPEAEVRVEAAKSLCLMKYDAYLDVIQTALSDQQTVVRVRAYRALSKIKGERALAMLMKQRPARKVIDRIWNAYALHQLQEQPTAQLTFLSEKLLSLPAAYHRITNGNPSEKNLDRAAKLASPGASMRQQAALALSRIGSDPALKLLVQATGDLALADERNGPRNLLRRHGPAAARALSAGLQDDSTMVRLGSAETIARLRSPGEAAQNTLKKTLGACLADDAGLVRQACARAIAALDLSSLAGRLLQTMKQPDPDTRRAAAEALGHLALAKTAPPLILHLTHETHRGVIRSIYRSLAAIGAPDSAAPLFARLRQLIGKNHQGTKIKEEINLCVRAIGASGEDAAEKTLRMLPSANDEQRKIFMEILAHSGSRQGMEFFLDRLREAPPEADGPEVRFFSSLDANMADELERLIQSESAMWIRIILARALFGMGKSHYARGISWGLRNEDPYLQKLAAAVSVDVDIPGIVNELSNLMNQGPQTAYFAARALLASADPDAISSFLSNISRTSLRNRNPLPLKAFWDAEPSAAHPFSKEVDGDRVWVVFADNRLGRPMDLFLTWSVDGRIWKEPIYTGLTSFASLDGTIAPPTFSLKVRERAFTIALTRTFARSVNAKAPRFKNVQRVHRFKLKDFFKDRDSDGLNDFEEESIFTRVGYADTDRDGLDDGKDKNPLAKPAAKQRNIDILPLLAFSYATLVAEILPRDLRLLVVMRVADQRPPPELPTFPGLVLHLDAEQVRSLWKSSGGGFPRIRFLPPRITHNGERAIQAFRVISDFNDQETFQVSFVKKNQQWTIEGLQR